MNMPQRETFSVSVSEYAPERNFTLNKVTSLANPADNAVMFVTKKHAVSAGKLELVRHCLVFWPKEIEIPEALREKHAFVLSERPRLEFCRFFEIHGIRSLPEQDEYVDRDGALVARGVEIGEGTVIMPGAVIGGGVRLGKKVFVGAGAKITCDAKIGDNTIIRENVTIGSDGLALETDYDGHHIWFPQFGGVQIGKNVSLGANVVVERGALDDTIIGDGVKIDSSSVISHNCVLDENCIICAGVVLCGSVKAGKAAYIAPSATILNQISIGENACVGVASNVLKKVRDGQRVFGNPASPILF